MTLGGKFAGFTACMKQFLDFKRLSAGICPCKEWALFVSCLAFSTLAHTSRRILGGAIPVCTYGIRGRLVCSSSESRSLSLA